MKGGQTQLGKRMLINEECKKCQLRQNINAYPQYASQEDIMSYQDEVKNLIEHSDGFSTPQIVEQIYSLRFRLFSDENDYSDIKRHYNDLMLAFWPYMQRQVEMADDNLRMAIQFAMVGNYIDFGALNNVNEKDLKDQLDKAMNIPIEPDILEGFRGEVLRFHHLVLFTDNCGEIVTDKLLISVLRAMNPELTVTVIVRGKPVVNDATLEDASQIGMEEVAHRVIGNGTGMPGNVIGAISSEAMNEVNKADILVAKGQGNYEGLSGCGLNIFYLFQCKCDLFMRRFNVPQFTGILTRERGPGPL